MSLNFSPRTKRLTTISLLGTLGLFLSISACASRPDRGGPPQGGGPDGVRQVSFSGTAAQPIGLLFTSMDVDRDARVSIEELNTGIAKEWGILAESGRVGALTYRNWSQIVLGSDQALPSFISFDRDLNGTLTEVEFSDRLRAEFINFDKNSDAILDRSELVFVITAPVREERGGQQGGGEGGGQGGRGSREGGPPQR